jgi:hypothetical protein
MAINETLNYLFDDVPHLLSPSLNGWMSESVRFATFVETYRDKIRKKIRTARDPDSSQDLQAELETAYLLLREPRFDLAYEPYGRGGMRGPDFAVTFRTHTTFNVEVTRMRMALQELDPGRVEQAGYRLADIVCSKLGQMPPGIMNLLVIMADSQAICELDIAQVLKQLKLRAEQKDPRLYQRHRFRNPADFFKYFQRLSGILVRSAGDDGPGRCPILWLNSQAKHVLPRPICHSLERLDGLS